MQKIKSVLALAFGLTLATLGQAHHSGAMFDQSKKTVLTGTVTQFNWTNPHASFKVEVPDAAGKSQIWAIEMNSPHNLVREGWKRTSIKPGDKVTVTVNPLRDGRPGGWYLAITLADGRRLSTTAGPAG